MATDMAVYLCGPLKPPTSSGSLRSRPSESFQKGQQRLVDLLRLLLLDPVTAIGQDDGPTQVLHVFFCLGDRLLTPDGYDIAITADEGCRYGHRLAGMLCQNFPVQVGVACFGSRRSRTTPRSCAAAG